MAEPQRLACGVLRYIERSATIGAVAVHVAGDVRLFESRHVVHVIVVRLPGGRS